MDIKDMRQRFGDGAVDAFRSVFYPTGAGNGAVDRAAGHFADDYMGRIVTGIVPDGLIAARAEAGYFDEDGFGIPFGDGSPTLENVQHAIRNLGMDAFVNGTLTKFADEKRQRISVITAEDSLCHDIMHDFTHEVLHGNVAGRDADACFGECAARLMEAYVPGYTADREDLMGRIHDAHLGEAALSTAYGRYILPFVERETGNVVRGTQYGAMLLDYAGDLGISDNEIMDVFTAYDRPEGDEMDRFGTFTGEDVHYVAEALKDLSAKAGLPAVEPGKAEGYYRAASEAYLGRYGRFFDPEVDAGNNVYYMVSNRPSALRGIHDTAVKCWDGLGKQGHGKEAASSEQLGQAMPGMKPAAVNAGLAPGQFRYKGQGGPQPQPASIEEQAKMSCLPGL